MSISKITLVAVLVIAIATVSVLSAGGNGFASQFHRQNNINLQFGNTGTVTSDNQQSTNTDNTHTFNLGY
jgi:hypothetical protein